MARPSKLTVEWFPHPVAHGKVVYVLEEAYGNDGYAFWFKIRETLGETSGHYIDCRTHGAWAHLLSKVRLQNGKAEAIMGALANMDAIDRELWEKCRVIWSDDYVKDLKPVYDRRKLPLPVRPESLLLHPITDTRVRHFEGFGEHKPTRVGFPGIEVVERGSREREVEVGEGSVPQVLRGLELYENNGLLLKHFLRNYNNWKRSCLHIDVDYEIRQAHSWEIDNPEKQKTDKARFLGGWLRGEDEKQAKAQPQESTSTEEKVRQMRADDL